ncbi:hypothetical protein CAEBREN_15232 [Caenorhabditis brenneri]|uniref:SPK domain-containing protein n=1 Tax=Caenorhabditis brenneri TaxID=135651 RepID=G0P4V9_CAEBE|nr:hypothetical protein CAEBREN_15232 [Caenorhabditis brenneri]
MEFLVEKSKTATSPVGLTPLIEEFVRLHGHYHDQDTICRRFREKTARKIHALPGFSDEDKAKVLFVTSVPVNKAMLAELEKNALVELDTNRRIIKFVSTNELVKFEGTHQRQVPVNTINSPAPADPKKRKVEMEEQVEQKEPPMKKTRGEEEEKEEGKAPEEMVVVKEEEVVTSEMAQSQEELPEVQEEARAPSPRVEDHVEHAVAPDVPEVEMAVPEAPEAAPGEEKEVEIPAEEIAAVQEAPKAEEEPKIAPEAPEEEKDMELAAKENAAAPEAPEAPEQDEAPENAAEEEMEMAQEEPLQIRGFSPPREEQPEEPANAPEAPEQGAALEAPQQDLPAKNLLEQEVKKEIVEDPDTFGMKSVVYPPIEPGVVKEEMAELAQGMEGILAKAIENEERGRQNGEGTSLEIRRSSRKSIPTWRRSEASESSEPPRGRQVTAPEAAEASESRRVTRSRTSIDAPPKKEAAPKAVVKTIPVPKSVAKTIPVPKSVAKTTPIVKKVEVSPIIKPKGMEGPSDIKKRTPKAVTPWKTRGKSLVDTPKSSKRREKKAPEPSAEETSGPPLRRSARMSEAREKAALKAASAPPTPAPPAKPVVTRNVNLNDSGSMRVRHPTVSELVAPVDLTMPDTKNELMEFIQEIDDGGKLPLSQGPSISAAPSYHRVTAKHFLEHTRNFVVNISTPQFIKMTKKFDAVIDKMKDNEPLEADKLEKALQSIITILTSKK